MSWVIERPDLALVQDPNAPPRTRSSPRRPHTKSKLGCITCKQRRIKCDETRPKCSQCRDRNVQCVFRPPKIGTPGEGRRSSSIATMKHEDCSEASLSPVSTSSPASSTSPLPDISTVVFDSERHSAVEPMPRELAKARILMHLELANQPNNLKASDDAYTRADVPELFDHFIDTAEAWAGSSECQRVLQTWSPSLSVMHTFLLHGMLAFSASHLQSFRPWEKKYGLAAALHCGLSLQGFSATLSQRVDHDNADALFACCYLHTMLALYNKSRCDQASMVDNDFAWLRGMKGIPILQRTNVLRPHLNHSIWLPVFVETKAYSAEIGHLPTPTNEHSAAFPQIEILRAQCQVNRLDPDNDENPYAIPLAHLDRLSRLSSIGNGQIGMLMVFIGRMPECFVALLERLDPLAMRILALWCDYAGQVEQWWCTGPARQEAARLRRILQRRETSKTPDTLA